MHEPNHFLQLFILIFLALVAPLLLSRFRRVRVPLVVGEIIAGIIVGRSGLNLIAPDEAILDFLAEFGLIFLMFLSGMEIDFSNLGFRQSKETGAEPAQQSPIVLAGINFGLTLVLSLIVGLALALFGLVRNPWMMALILSTTSLGVVVPVLKETRLISGRYGQTLLVSALVADFVTMLLITLLVAGISRGLSPELLLIGVLFLAFFLAYRFGLFVNRIPAVRATIEELSHATSQIKIRLAFALMLVFVVLAQAAGTEIILGAFLAGAIIALTATPSDEGITHQLEMFGFGFFIPIFFIKVGVDFDLSVLFATPQALLLVPLLLLAAILVKLIPAMVFRKAFGMRDALTGGWLLSSRLSLIIAASAIGERLNIISSEVNSAIILVAILTVTFAPLIFTRLAPHPQQDTPSAVIIAGADELGIETARQIRGHKERVVLLDPNLDYILRARKAGFEAEVAAVEQDDPAARPYLEKARVFICTYTDPDLSYRACQVARTDYGIQHIVSQVTNPARLSDFDKLGIATVNPALDRATLLVLLALNPATYQLLTRTDDSKEVAELMIQNHNQVGRSLRQLHLPGDVLILALRRNGELLVPHGDTRLEWGDYITLAGTTEWVLEAQVMFDTG